MEKTRIAAILPRGKIFERVFSEGILPAACELGSEIERVDTEFSARGSLKPIFEMIERSSLVIADLTACNPNVMFLAGHAAGLGKTLICIAQHAENFPIADLDHPSIIYAGDPKFLKEELLPSLRGTSRRAAPAEENPRAKFLSTFGDLMQKHQQQHRGEILMENPTTFVLVDQDLDLALVQDLARRGRELGIRIKLM
jgi:hypothetical protein